ncbi:unnamed protein product [Penicillium manginii]
MDDEREIDRIGMSTMHGLPPPRRCLESALESRMTSGLFTGFRIGLAARLSISKILALSGMNWHLPTIAVMTSHRADASSFLDNRGYSGPLVRGVNPITLFEKAVRDRITDSYYWKEQCFGLNAATLCDRAVELSSIGGTYGVSEKPTPFLCLAFKLLQLNPDRNVILEYLNFSDPGSDDEGEDNGVVKDRGDFKYLRALAAFYVRITFDAAEVYKTLEPLLLDYRKIKRRIRDTFALTYMDQFVDDLLTKDRVCGTSLWKLPPRQQLEDLDMLDERVSPLEGELEELDQDSDDGKSDEEREISDKESSGKGNEEDD